MKTHIESLLDLMLQPCAAQPQAVQQLAAELRSAQQLLDRLQAGQSQGAQVLLQPARERQLRVHFGEGGAAAPLNAGFSLRLSGGSRAELDGHAVAEVLIPPAGGEICYLGQVLCGGWQTAPGSREWRDSLVSYCRFDDGDRQHLLIAAGASSVFLQDWRNADLGIWLRDGAAPAPMQIRPRY